MVPLQDEFGWSRALISAAVSVNLLLYGLTAPFAAALMDRFGIRQVTSVALLLVAAGSGLTVFVTAGWQLMLCLGRADRAGHRLDGAGLRRHHRQPLVRPPPRPGDGRADRRGAAGQLVFLPLMAWLAERLRLACRPRSLSRSPRWPSCRWCLLLRDYPADRRRRAYGGADRRRRRRRRRDPARRGPARGQRSARGRPHPHLLGAGRRLRDLRRHHQRSDRHPFHSGRPRPRHAETTAAGLLALVGIFDIVGTIASGALTDRINPRILLGGLLRASAACRPAGAALRCSPTRCSRACWSSSSSTGWTGWPPCRRPPRCAGGFGADGTIVFGWVFAAHQFGAAIAAVGAGIIRDSTGDYTIAWFGAAALCVVAAAVSFGIRQPANANPPLRPHN